MYFRVKPPFVRAISWFPPRAPVPCWWTLMWVESIISHSKSGSPETATRIFSHTPRSLHRQYLRWVFFQPPKSGGRSLHGAPVRNIQNTAFMNNRLSVPCRPTFPFLPGSNGSNTSHNLSPISCLLCTCLSILPLLLLFPPFSTFYLTTLSSAPGCQERGGQIPALQGNKIVAI